MVVTLLFLLQLHLCILLGEGFLPFPAHFLVGAFVFSFLTLSMSAYSR